MLNLKKVFCIFLCLIFCFLVSACQTKENSNSSVNSEINSVANMENKEKFKGESDFLKIVVGKWTFCSKSNNSNGINAVEIFDDYTLKFDDKSYKWDFNAPIKQNSEKEYDSLKSDKITIDVYENEELTNQFEISKFYENDEYHFLSFGGNQIYANNNDFEIVDITLDNYQEYFELKDYFMPIKDKFGDYTGSVDFSRQFTIKDGIKVFDRYSKVEYKGTASVSIYGFEFDKSDESYKILDLLTEHDEVYPFNESCYMRDDGVYTGKIDGRAYEVLPGMGYENYEYVVEYPDRVSIDGVIGKIYICR